MKRIFLTIIFAVLTMSTAIFGQERIAVFPFEDTENILTRNEMTMFYRNFSNEFTNRSVGRFAVVPRQEVERLINTEVAFQLSDFSSKEKTAEMQRVLNGTQILSGSIGKWGNNILIIVSLYTYPELQQLPGGVTKSVPNKDELLNKIPELVQEMQDIITGISSGIEQNRNATAIVHFIGTTLEVHDQDMLIQDLQRALKDNGVLLQIIPAEEALNATYNFLITLRTTPRAATLTADLTIAFRRGNRVLQQSKRHTFNEMNMEYIIRKGGEFLRGDTVFFRALPEIIAQQ